MAARDDDSPRSSKAPHAPAEEILIGRKDGRGRARHNVTLICGAYSPGPRGSADNRLNRRGGRPTG
jgi:hypothetical protein